MNVSCIELSSKGISFKLKKRKCQMTKFVLIFVSFVFILSCEQEPLPEVSSQNSQVESETFSPEIKKIQEQYEFAFDRDVINPVVEKYQELESTQAFKKTLNKRLMNCSGSNCSQLQKLISLTETQIIDLKNEINQRIQQEHSKALSSKRVVVSNVLSRQGLRSNGNYCQLENFAPDPFDPIKIVKVHFHYPQMGSIDKPGHFTSAHDGQGKKTLNAYDRSRNYINSINSRLGNNETPRVNSYHKLKTKMRVRLHGVSLPMIPEEELDDYYYSNNTLGGRFTGNSSKIRDGKYFRLKQDSYNVVFQEQNGIDKVNRSELVLDDGKMVNSNNPDEYLVKVFPHLNIRTGNGYANGILNYSSPSFTMLNSEWTGYLFAQRGWNHIQNDGSNELEPKPVSLWSRASLFNHEMGHSLGLNHPWISSGSVIHEHGTTNRTYVKCEDIKREKGPWCGNESTNNVMDYNCSQGSWSPCQLTIVHYNLMGSQNDMLYKPCLSDDEYPTILEANLGTVVWDAPHDLPGDLIVKAGTKLVVGCAVSMARNARIIIEDGGEIENRAMINKRPACVKQLTGELQGLELQD